MTLTEGASDEEVASLVQKGDAEAFGLLMQRYRPKLVRYGKRFLGDTDLIEDAVQETFIKTYKNIQGFDVHQRFSPWVYRIAHNVFVNTLRAKSRGPLFALDLDTLIPHATYEDPMLREREQQEIRQVLETGFEQIPLPYREVLVLYYLEEMSYKEIADVLRVPVGTVGIRLSRARSALKKKLDTKTL